MPSTTGTGARCSFMVPPPLAFWLQFRPPGRPELQPELGLSNVVGATATRSTVTLSLTLTLTNDD